MGGPDADAVKSDNSSGEPLKNTPPTPPTPPAPLSSALPDDYADIINRRSIGVSFCDALWEVKSLAREVTFGPDMKAKFRVFNLIPSITATCNTKTQWVGLLFDNTRNPALNGAISWTTTLKFYDGTKVERVESGILNYGRFWTIPYYTCEPMCGTSFSNVCNILEQVREIAICVRYVRAETVQMEKIPGTKA